MTSWWLCNLPRLYFEVEFLWENETHIYESVQERWLVCMMVDEVQDSDIRHQSLVPVSCLYVYCVWEIFFFKSLLTISVFKQFMIYLNFYQVVPVPKQNHN